jgi:uncharacterized protein (TIGR04255 family)
LRGIRLGPLRDRWREAYPLVEEQPALAPAFEASMPQGVTVEFGLGPLPPVRYWFLSEDSTELVQLQHDRLIINWRQGDDVGEYPRYEHMRALFLRRFQELSEFVAAERLGALEISQAELNYINAVDADPAEQRRLDRLLRGWATPEHHLGEPVQARMNFVYELEGVAPGPVRMYVGVDPAQRPDGRPVSFFTLTVRGGPADSSLEAATKFMDAAHEHLVRSFAELTPDDLQAEWGRYE